MHFNRGVAGSQAYAREFNNQRPDRMEADLQKKAFKWLSKGLEEALLRFVKQAKDNTCQLRCCFYEFEFAVVLEALKAAAATGADVKIIYAATAEKYLAYWNLLKNDPDNAATRAGGVKQKTGEAKAAPAIQSTFPSTLSLTGCSPAEPVSFSSC